MPADPTLHVSIRTSAGGFSLDVAFDAPPGITILFGPSGSGKSTTLAIIAGLVRPDRARIALGDDVWFDSETRVDRAVHRRGVAFVFQSLALFPHMTAAANVAYGIDRAMDGRARAKRAREFLDRLRVGHLADRKPRTFSGGEAQRVALARALAMSPRIVLLDEPFSALDRDLRKDLALDVRALIKELKVPMIHVTHHRNEARAIADRVILIEKGRIVRQGTASVLADADEDGRVNGARDMSFDDTPMPEDVRKELEKL